MRSVPSPLIVDVSSKARLCADGTVSDDFLRLLDGDAKSGGSDGSVVAVATTMNVKRRMRKTRSNFMDRIRCQLILPPSGRGMSGGGLSELAGSLTFSKLLYGGVTRYRILPSSSEISSAARSKPPRRAGEHTERKMSASGHVPSWVQYGVVERRYDAVDMGPAMVLEFTLLPKIQGGVVENLHDWSRPAMFCSTSSAPSSRNASRMEVLISTPVSMTGSPPSSPGVSLNSRLTKFLIASAPWRYTLTLPS
jgi:hypothetical protein